MPNSIQYAMCNLRLAFFSIGCTKINMALYACLMAVLGSQGNVVKCTIVIFFGTVNSPVLNYASVLANNNLKSKLELSGVIHLLNFLAHLRTNLDFRLLFVGT